MFDCDKYMAIEKFKSLDPFHSQARLQAKILTNIEFKFDPLTDILPTKTKKDIRDAYMKRWKELTQEIISKKKVKI